MIEEFTKRYFAKLPELREKFTAEHPSEYMEIVRAVVSILSDGQHGEMDISRIHEIDDGDYQGTLVYVIAGTGYQPTDYWYVRVYYGSCSGCDTLEGIREYDSGAPKEDQIKQYMTLAMHIVQGLKKMGGDVV